MASTTLTAYITLRAVSGAYTTSLSASTKPKEWRPSINVPLGYVSDDGKTVRINESWFRYFRFLGNNKLGGATFPTLPEVVTQSQLNSAIASSAEAITAAQDQQNAANAQALEALRQVVEGLTSTAAVPPVVLVRQEVAPPPPSTPIVGVGEAGGGAGGE